VQISYYLYDQDVTFYFGVISFCEIFLGDFTKVSHHWRGGHIVWSL